MSKNNKDVEQNLTRQNMIWQTKQDLQKTKCIIFYPSNP